MKLIVVRHAETEENKNNILNGQLDCNLSKGGMSQAQKTAKELEKYDIDIAFSSDIKQCVDTVNILLTGRNIPTNYSDKLREQNLGHFQGSRKDNYLKIIENSGIRFYEFVPDGGESYNTVKERVVNFLESIFKNHENDTVLIVSHSVPIVSLLMYVMKDTFENYNRYKPQNCSITIIEYSETPKIEIDRSTDHLSS